MSTPLADEQQTAKVPSDTFGSRLLLLRHDLHLTVDEISTMCGVASATWSTWEWGARPRDKAELVRAIANATGYSADWLMWGSELPLRGEVEADCLDREFADLCTGQLTLAR
jgi:transcriptional regulator with XRE-family HTH domain